MISAHGAPCAALVCGCFLVTSGHGFNRAAKAITEIGFSRREFTFMTPQQAYTSGVQVGWTRQSTVYLRTEGGLDSTVAK
jgi:hypothetical protein